MSKMFQVYGLGQALIPVLPPPIKFLSTPTETQTNFEVGQVAYTIDESSTTFYMYAGAGVWANIGSSSGSITDVEGTANQITVSVVNGVATISLPSAIVAPGSITATTTLTATLGNITATNGNFVASTAGSGILLNSPSATIAATDPAVVNGRSGRATFTSVSIAADADLTLTITNSAITAATTIVLVSMSGATTGSALSIKSKTASAGSLAIVVTNGTGATTSTADIQIDFLVVNT